MTSIPEGCYVNISSRIKNQCNSILFLDRDGVINHDGGYTHKVSDLKVITGVASSISLANNNSIPVIIVTNQSGIGRGYYGWEDFEKFHSALDEELLQSNAWIDGVIACGVLPREDIIHPWRKPNPGMLEYVCDHLNCTRSLSWIVGDRESDIVAGMKAGLQGGILISTAPIHKHHSTFMTFTTENSSDAIQAATNYILLNNR